MLDLADLAFSAWSNKFILSEYWINILSACKQIGEYSENVDTTYITDSAYYVISCVCLT